MQTDPRREVTEKDGRDGGGIKHTLYIPTPFPRRWKMFLLIALPLAEISLRFVLPSSCSVSRAILPEEYNSTVLRPESRRAARDGPRREGWRFALNVQLLYHEISARKLDNALPVGPGGGAQRIKEEDARGEGKQGTREIGTGVCGSSSRINTAPPPQHARYIHI